MPGRFFLVIGLVVSIWATGAAQGPQKLWGLEAVTPFERVSAVGVLEDGRGWAQGSGGGIATWGRGLPLSVEVVRPESTEVMLAAAAPNLTWATVDVNRRVDVGEGADVTLSWSLVQEATVLGFSASGKYLVIGDEVGVVNYWDATGAKILWQLKLSSEAITAVAVGDELVAVGTEGGEVHVVDREGEVTHEMIRVEGGAVRALAMDAEGSRLAVGSSGHEFSVWDLMGDVPERLESRMTAAPWVEALTVGEGLRFVAGAGPELVSEWGFRTRSGIAGQVTALRSLGRDTLMVGGSDGAVRWIRRPMNTDGKRPTDHAPRWFPSEDPMRSPHAGDVLAVAWHPRAVWVASGAMDGQIRLWDPERKRRPKVMRSHRGAIVDLSVHPSDEFIASAGSDGTLRVWDPRKLAEVWRESRHDGRLGTCAFSPCGRYLASGDSAGVVRVFRWPERVEVAHFRIHRESMKCLAWDARGRWLATGSADGTVAIIDLATWDVVQRLSCRREGVSRSTSMDWRSIPRARGWSPVTSTATCGSGVARAGKRSRCCAATRRASRRWTSMGREGASSRVPVTAPSGSGTSPP